MWRNFLMIICMVWACVIITTIPSSSLASSRYAAIVIEEKTGRVLFSRNADKKLYPASLTKIMTLYMLFEELEAGRLTMKSRLPVSRIAASRSPSKLYLAPGSSISVENAILALVTKSANDVATVVGEKISGTERAFAGKMTRKARALGMVNTTFKNASGLPNRKQHSTARDMARLGVAIRRDFPQYYHYFSRTKFSFNGRNYGNHNKLLRLFDGTDGIKTGYTGASGFNLVAATERNGVRLIGVVFGGRSGATRDAHMMKILATQFRRVKPFAVRQIAAPAAPPPRPNVPKRPQVKQSQTQLATLFTPQEEVATQNPQGWAIQVGSFARRVNAHKAALDARRNARDVLGLVPAQLSVVVRGEMPLWRVRFGNLEETEARAACAALFLSGKACIALPTG
ncbi:MAG: serine hydrolase [Candidatus Puniceispirillaceae bacterium]